MTQPREFTREFTISAGSSRSLRSQNRTTNVEPTQSKACSQAHALGMSQLSVDVIRQTIMDELAHTTQARFAVRIHGLTRENRILRKKLKQARTSLVQAFYEESDVLMTEDDDVAALFPNSKQALTYNKQK